MTILLQRLSSHLMFHYNKKILCHSAGKAVRRKLGHSTNILKPISMAIRVVEFSNGGYKIRKVFA
jgi:hypothetical protein